MALEPELASLVQEFDNVVAKRIDIGRNTPAGKQLSEDYNPGGIPYLRIYNPNGEFIDEVVGGDLPKIRRIIQPFAKK